jgi:uncharacterized membrane protein
MGGARVVHADPLPDPERALDRLVFFSDAVFAIAITLLVIDLRVPALGHDVADEQLAAALLDQGSRVMAYLLSFMVIGIYWYAHWRRFRYVRRLNGRLVVLNLLLLAFVAFIPFPTALMAEYGDRDIAVVVYAVSIAAAGILGPVSWTYAARAGLLAEDAPDTHGPLAAMRTYALPTVVLGSLLLLPIVPTHVVELSWFLVVPIEILLSRLR